MRNHCHNYCIGPDRVFNRAADSKVLPKENRQLSLFNTQEGFYVLPFTSDGQLNVYGDLMSVRAVPYNGMTLNKLDTVPRILYDNSARQTFDLYLKAFADRLAYIQKSISIVERQARFPPIVKVNEDNKESFARFESKVDEGYLVIYIDETMDTDAMQVFETGFSSEIFTALWNDYNKVEGEIYALLGTMFNVEQNKAGVGTAETIVNYSQPLALANSRLHSVRGADRRHRGGRPTVCGAVYHGRI